MTAAPKPKPCPFKCGNTPLKKHISTNEEGDYGVYCCRCWATGPLTERKCDAIAAWNRREKKP